MEVETIYSNNLRVSSYIHLSGKSQLIISDS